MRFMIVRKKKLKNSLGKEGRVDGRTFRRKE